MLIKNGVNFSEITYLDCSSCPSYTRSARDSAVVMREGNGFMEIQTQVEGGGWLVVGESDLPGWKAEVDGQEVPIIKANGFGMAIEVPAEKHSIMLTYTGMRNELRWLKFLGLVE